VNVISIRRASPAASENGVIVFDAVSFIVNSGLSHDIFVIVTGTVEVFISVALSTELVPSRILPNDNGEPGIVSSPSTTKLGCEYAAPVKKSETKINVKNENVKWIFMSLKTGGNL
jgi:hypothetical protein